MEVKRFIFNIKAKNDALVNDLKFMATDYADAEKKLMSIYQQCQVIDWHVETVILRDKQAPGHTNPA